MLELNRRIWDDAPYGQMSSDGEQVFILWGLVPSTSQPSVLVQQFGIQRPNQAGTMDTNKLVALDLKAQGKLRWIVGDEDGTDEPQLAGALLPRPAASADGPTVCAGRDQWRDPIGGPRRGNGRMEWSQQLAHVDARNIRTRPRPPRGRRHAVVLRWCAGLSDFQRRRRGR